MGSYWPEKRITTDAVLKPTFHSLNEFINAAMMRLVVLLADLIIELRPKFYVKINCYYESYSIVMSIFSDGNSIRTGLRF
jgi:hypothetical protein